MPQVAIYRTPDISSHATEGARRYLWLLSAQFAGAGRMETEGGNCSQNQPIANGDGHHDADSGRGEHTVICFPYSENGLLGVYRRKP